MNLFLPLALIKSPGYLTEQYHVFSDEIIFEFITWNYLIGNKVEIRDLRTKSFVVVENDTRIDSQTRKS